MGGLGLRTGPSFQTLIDDCVTSTGGRMVACSQLLGSVHSNYRSIMYPSRSWCRHTWPNSSVAVALHRMSASATRAVRY